MIKKFSIDRDRVAAILDGKETANAAALRLGEEANDLHRKIFALKQKHETESRLAGRRWSAPPSELAELARLEKAVVAAKARHAAAQVAWTAIGRLATRVDEYANSRGLLQVGSIVMRAAR
ncbi:hypothetical protein AB4Z40_31990 [Bosea sp. 2YAB26]|uniref:hypothetical protein n=1 Tax=Bosea sp. 2YAB26 TaxID=3237478 RepID=UPI003F92581D